MNDRPLVSIGIPTYDRPELLGQSLRSALEQTYENLEILVADDGTNPGTEEVVRELAGSDERVRYERNERNLGGVGNGIKVLQAATGEFQKMLLDDDLLAPTHIETLLAPMLEDASITLAFSKRTIIDEHGNVLPDPPGMSGIASQVGRVSAHHLIALIAQTTTNWIGEQSTVLFRSRVVEHRKPFIFVGSEPSGILADLCMHLDALARGDAWYTPEPLSSFRQHGGQVSQDAAIHLPAACDWVMIQERLHLIDEVAPTAERLAVFGRIASALANLLVQTPHAAAAPRAQDALERMVGHIRALREHDQLIDVPRASIVLVARAAGVGVLEQLQAIIDVTPADAFEVVIATVDPEPALSQLLAGLEGDVQVVDASGAADPICVATDQARHELVIPLAEGELPRRGWIADAFDERTIAHELAAAQ